MDTVLQIWGGGFYLINKAFFALSENQTGDKKNQFIIIAWSCYLIGVPAWVVILVGKNNWIAASIELAGVSAMVLGLYQTLYKTNVKPAVESAVRYSIYLAIAFGVLFSLNHYGGLRSITQVLEIFVTVGFLLGGYLMAQANKNGYLLFMLMNISMAILMLIQGKHILVAQQLASLLFVIYGFSRASKKSV